MSACSAGHLAELDNVPFKFTKTFGWERVYSNIVQSGGGGVAGEGTRSGDRRLTTTSRNPQTIQPYP